VLRRFDMRKVVLACLLSCSSGVIVFAQSVAGLGAISGTVRDNTGAPISGAGVVIENAAKGIHRQVLTNATRCFSAPSLVLATEYSISVSKSGFATYQRRDIELQVGQNMSLDLVLHVAGTLLQIDVETEAPLVEPTRMDVSQVITSSQIRNLPI